MSIGKCFLSAVLAENSVSSLLAFGPIEHLFKANEVDSYLFVREFVKKYQKLPDVDTIENHVGQDAIVKHKETSAYYHDLLRARHTEIELKKGMKKASDLLMPDTKDPEEALRVLMDVAMALATQKMSKQVVDFRQAYEIIVSDYAKKFNEAEEYGLHLGWPYFDALSGGLSRGDLISIVGRPQKGKTWQMLYALHHGWQKGGKKAQPQSRMFVSMEMDPLLIQQRLASMQSSIPMTGLKHADLSTGQMKQLKKGLTEIKSYGAPFWIVDGNLTATVEDIWMLARQLKPDALGIDGGYLVKHPTERDRYRRVAENADLMKQELAAICPTIVSWQFAKSAAKKNAKKGEKVDLEDIGYTDAIAQVSSIVLAMLEEDSVESLVYRVIDILKGRNGEVGRFKTRWDFKNMDFSEFVEQDVSELQYV
jgi:hypothetical protein